MTLGTGGDASVHSEAKELTALKTTPSRIAAARRAAAAAKQSLMVGAACLFGLLVLFLRAGTTPAGAGTSDPTTAFSSGDARSDVRGYDDSLGGGAISPPADDNGFPSARTRTS